MSQILLSTKKVTTYAQAQMTLVSTGYTTAKFNFTNPSLGPAMFRIVDGSAIRVSQTTIEAGATVTLEATGLVIGSTNDYFLHRTEFGTWRSQGTSVSASTKLITEVNASTSSKAAVLTWPNTHSSTHKVRVYNKTDLNTMLQEVTNVTLNSSTNKNEVVISSLSNQITYIAHIVAVETFSHKLIKSVEFTPSDLANLNIDAVFATYTELSWDDGDVGQDEEDDEAEFKLWRQPTDKSTPWFNTMDWTPDTTKTFTDTGLAPGVEYKYQFQRLGVNNKPFIQDRKTFTTKTTELSDGKPWSTVIHWGWTELYEGAVTRYRLTPEGGETVTAPVSGTIAVLRNLTPDTDYTFELVVVEKGEEVVVDTSVQKTDKYGVLSLQQAGYTTATFSIQSLATNNTTYYVANEDESIKSANISFDAGDVTKTVQLNGFGVNSTNKIFLKRAEFGHWNIQSGSALLDHISTTMLNLTAATSIASTSAMIQWVHGYDGADYQVSVYYSAPNDQSVVPDQLILNGDIANSGGQRSAIITGLEMDTPYWGVISVTENNASGVPAKVFLQPFNFDTSAGATFIVGETKASIVQLSWDAGVVEEADGIAEFKVRKQEVSVGTWTDATSWLPHDTNSFTKVAGLKAGVAYRFELVRLGLGGNEISQAIVDVSTKTSTLTIAGTASGSIDTSWTELYPGASYQLMYTIDGGSPVTFGGGPISQTSALLEGLEFSTKYVIELYAIEDGQAVGLATSALGSAASAETGTNPLVIVGGVTVAAVVVGLVVYKMKFAAAAKALR